MRVASSVTAVSWIPSEAIEGLTRLPFDLGVGHYDPPPPDTIDDLEALHRAGRFRFANHLSAWVEVEDGRIVDHGHAGRSYLTPTLLRLGPLPLAFQPTAFPDLRSVPDASDTAVRFVQTSGGRPGVPAPRLVEGKPFVQVTGPVVWTTLALTVRADGSSDWELAGATGFPRHWVYDHTGTLVAKSGLTRFKDWYHTAAAGPSPWGAQDSPIFVTTAETALERQLSAAIMGGRSRPSISRLRAGAVLVEQGQAGEELYLLLDGLVSVEVDGEKVAEVGPGAVVGERALLEGARRTATLRAVTDCKVARASGDQVDHRALAELAAGHHRERSSGPPAAPGG